MSFKPLFCISYLVSYNNIHHIIFRFGSKAETIENREMAILSFPYTKMQYLRNVGELFEM